ncbi:MAG TPA: PQQ-binding-like beta-propeller repeat protein [Candidatus Sulfotelmatobacter sp.]|nr:PQQ-binding-like beta-propeller repeat protein [Candidatus Sulfotelmatobacter sp.]
MRLSSKVATVITTTLLLASITLIAIPYPIAQAQLASQQPTAGPLPSGITPDIMVDVNTFLGFSPNPIGLGQTLLVNVWLVPPIHVGRQFIQAFTVTITKPDGTKTIIGPLDSYQGDATAWFNYVPDQLGTWKLKFDFLGMYFPVGRYQNGRIVTNTSGTQLGSAYYKPGSTQELELTVQQDQVYSYPPAALPTDYWTRPAYTENREWWPILGNWPSTGVVGGGAYWPAKTNTYMSNYRFTPYVQGPNSPHVVWKQQYGIGGLIGGVTGQTSIVIEADAVVPSIIYSGRMYQTVSKVSQTGTGSQNYWQCLDLRTGQLYWERTLYSGESAPTMITYEPGGGEVVGADVFAGSWRVWLVSITSASGNNSGRVIKYNPLNGAVVANFTGPPSGVSSNTFYADPWVLSLQTIGSGSTAKYRLINWTIANNAGIKTLGSLGAQPVVDNFTQRIWGNTSWPFSSLGTIDFESGIAVVTQAITPTSTGVATGTILMGANVFTGQLLWNVTMDINNKFENFAVALPLADHGKFAVRNRDDAKEYCFDLYSGKLLWTSDLSAWPWGIFQAYDIQSAYGLIITNDYHGVRAIDWETGKTVWDFRAPSVPFETPYGGYYSWHSAGIVADGKLYTWNNEHTPSEPITRGWKLFCLNATTGEEIWSMSYSSNVGGGRSFAGAVADGYLAVSNSYDATMYILGKGKSAITVTAPDIAVPKGTGVVIKGTVLDQSPAQPGTPCVSKESMKTQMEYLHMQHPIDGIWHNLSITGVTVKLTAIDSNDKVTDIGEVTTSAYYGTFETTWTPPAEGTYRVLASFAGDDSYSSSSAATAVSVGPALTTNTDNQQNITVPDNTMTIIGVGIAVVIAVTIVGLLLFVALKKRQ